MPYSSSVDTRQPRGKFSELEDMSMNYPNWNTKHKWLEEEEESIEHLIGVGK